MAFSKSFIKALLGEAATDDKVQALVDAHMESVTALQKERDAYRADAEQVPELKKQLKAQQDGADWKQKFEDEHRAFEDFRAGKEAEALTARKSEAFRKALTAAGVREKYLDRILKLSASEIEALELDEQGAARDGKALGEKLRADWAEFIGKAGEKGADVPTPPEGGGSGITAEQFAKMGYAQRAELFSNDREAYNALAAAVKN